MTPTKIIDFLSDTLHYAKNIVSFYDYYFLSGRCNFMETQPKMVWYVVVIQICAFIIGKIEIYDF